MKKTFCRRKSPTMPGNRGQCDTFSTGQMDWRRWQNYASERTPLQIPPGRNTPFLLHAPNCNCKGVLPGSQARERAARRWTGRHKGGPNCGYGGKGSLHRLPVLTDPGWVGQRCCGPVVGQAESGWLVCQPRLASKRRRPAFTLRRLQCTHCQRHLV